MIIKNLNDVFSIFPDSMNWDIRDIIKNHTLDEDFMRNDFKKHLTPYSCLFICKYQKLSESFMEDFSNIMSWIQISEHQRLSRDFLIKHIDKIDIRCLIKNEHISYDIKKEIELLKNLTS